MKPEAAPPAAGAADRKDAGTAAMTNPGTVADAAVRANAGTTAGTAAGMNSGTAAATTAGTTSGSREQPWLLPLLWLSSPALPIGGFSWSQGLESGAELGLIKDEGTLEAYLRGRLRYSLGYWDLPLLKRMYACARAAELHALLELNALLLSGRESAELYQEELCTGRALCRLLESLNLMPRWVRGADWGYTAAFALAASAGEEVPPRQLLEGCAFCWLQNQITAACKCMAIGQTTGQGVLIRLLAPLQHTVQLALDLEDDELGCSLPASALSSMLHEHQYSRLFRS